MKSPKISIIMSVYNGQEYLRPAIDSILYQAFTDFEFLIIDDGSSDSSPKILSEYAKRDSRIRILTQKNKGLVASLNRGLKEAKADWVARMDADDISLPKRFEKQFRLTKEKDVVLICGSFELINEDDVFLSRDVLPLNSEDIKRRFYHRNPIAHGSVMLKKSAVLEVGGYSSDVGPTEDLDLWIRLLKKGEFAAVDDVIYRWRVNTSGISSTNQVRQMKISKETIEKLWQTSPPSLKSWSYLKSSGNYYVNNFKYGVDAKNGFLWDNATIAIKMIRYKRIFSGLRQLLNVALIGRTGLRVAKRKLLKITPRTLNDHRKKQRQNETEAKFADN